MDTLREALSGDRLEVLQDRVLWYTEGDAALAFVHRLGFEPITAMVHRATLAFFAPGMLAAASMQNGIAEPAFPVSLCMLPMFLFATPSSRCRSTRSRWGGSWPHCRSTTRSSCCAA